MLMDDRRVAVFFFKFYHDEIHMNCGRTVSPVRIQTAVEGRWLRACPHAASPSSRAPCAQTYSCSCTTAQGRPTRLQQPPPTTTHKASDSPTTATANDYIKGGQLAYNNYRQRLHTGRPTRLHHSHRQRLHTGRPTRLQQPPPTTTQCNARPAGCGD